MPKFVAVVYFTEDPLEVVLSLLIESFRFSLSDKEIHWKAFGVTTPTVVGDPSHYKLPIIIEPAC